MEKVTDEIVDEVVYEYISSPEDVSRNWLGEFVEGDVDFDDFFHRVAVRLDGIAKLVQQGKI